MVFYYGTGAIYSCILKLSVHIIYYSSALYSFVLVLFAQGKKQYSRLYFCSTVPAAPRFLVISDISPINVTLQWAPPLSIPGLLKKYQIIAQLLSTVCEPRINTSREDGVTLDCVDTNITLSLNVANAIDDKHNVTVQSLSKYRYYRFKVAAVTNAGVGNYTQWIYERTLPGSKYKLFKKME